MKKIGLILTIAIFSTTSCLKLGNALSDLSNLMALLAIVSSSAHAVAVGDQGKAFTTADGITWTQVTVTTDTTINLQGVAYSGTQWVAVGGKSGSCNIFTSPTGDVWTARTVPFTCVAGANAFLHDVIFAKSLLVAVGGSAAATGRVLTSSDGGTSWTAGTTTATMPVRRVASDGASFMILDLDGLSHTSAAGAAYTLTSNVPYTGGAAEVILGTLTSLGAARFETVGYNSKAVFPVSSLTTNGGGTAWSTNAPTIFAAASTNTPQSLASNGSKLVAVGDTCHIDTSSNVTTPSWSNINSTMSACTGTFANTQWWRVVWDGTKFIAVGASGRIAYSPTGNANDWTIKAIGTASINGIASRP